MLCLKMEIGSHKARTRKFFKKLIKAMKWVISSKAQEGVIIHLDFISGKPASELWTSKGMRFYTKQEVISFCNSRRLTCTPELWQSL